MRIENDKDFGGLILRDLKQNNGVSVVLTKQEAKQIADYLQRMYDIDDIRTVAEHIRKNPGSYKIPVEFLDNLFANPKMLDDFAYNVRESMNAFNLTLVETMTDMYINQYAHN